MGFGLRSYQRRYELSKHAVDQSIVRDIRVAEIEEAITGRSETIEEGKGVSP